jgi:hypothetical protein
VREDGTCWLGLPPDKDALDEIEGAERGHRTCRNVTGEGLRNRAGEQNLFGEDLHDISHPPPALRGLATKAIWGIGRVRHSRDLRVA